MFKCLGGNKTVLATLCIGGPFLAGSPLVCGDREADEKKIPTGYIIPSTNRRATRPCFGAGPGHRDFFAAGPDSATGLKASVIFNPRCGWRRSVGICKSCSVPPARAAGFRREIPRPGGFGGIYAARRYGGFLSRNHQGASTTWTLLSRRLLLWRQCRL